MSSPTPLYGPESTLTSKIHPQRCLNFWDELDRKDIRNLEINNQRFAYEMNKEDFFDSKRTITESYFRRINGAVCRTRNGYCKYSKTENGKNIILFKKPFNNKNISVHVVGEFIVVCAHHKFEWNCLESPVDFEKPFNPETIKMEYGSVSRALVRRFMLPRGCSSSSVSYSFEDNENEIRIYIRWPAIPCERIIPILEA